MQIIENARSASGGSAQVAMPASNKPVMLVQVEITGAATVALQGRLSPAMPWFTIYTFTATGVAEISPVPLLRADSVIASGTVTVVAE